MTVFHGNERLCDGKVFDLRYLGNSKRVQSPVCRYLWHLLESQQFLYNLKS